MRKSMNPHLEKPVILGFINRQETAMLYPLATLETEKLNAIQDLEKDIGSPVVALAEVAADTAALPEDQLRKLQDLEEELGVVLVAVRPN